MAMFSELKRRWLGKDPDTLSKKDMGELRDALQSVKRDDLITLGDHRAFIEMLACYRRAIDTGEFIGANYKKTIDSLLSVGEDGLYSNDLRFVYELIQNADDCEYVDPEDCHLDIQFDANNGRIILRYNETGFSPFNVYAITGTAEAAKNIVDGVTQIGEKGIGFKSVFGVADSVLIQSGMFSFEVRKGNFSVPVPSYEDFKKVTGTQLTLFMSGKRVADIYSKLVKQYCKENALLLQNPIIFLNKLTRLSMLIDSWRSLTFSIDRGNEIDIGGMRFEADVRVSTELKDYRNGLETNIEKSVTCSRYSRDIVYNIPMLRSRYGADTKLNQPRRMTLRILYPVVTDVDKISQGALYSFLPTQVKLNMPIICHIPFKLDGSREFVDPQRNSAGEESEWFTHSCSEFAALLGDSCEDLAHRVGTQILLYLPQDKNGFIFLADNQKVDCLKKEILSVAELYKRPLFQTADGEFVMNYKCVTLEYDKPQEAYELLDIYEKLFLLPDITTEDGTEKRRFKASIYGFKNETNIVQKLLRRALSESDDAQAIYKLISDDKELDKLIDDTFFTNLTSPIDYHSIEAMAAFPKIWTLFKRYSVKVAQERKQPVYRLSISHGSDVRTAIYPDEEISADELGQFARQYLSTIRYTCRMVDIGAKQYFMSNNMLLLSNANCISSFAEFCSDLDSDSLFSINMRFREASAQLNRSEQDENVSDAQFIHDLSGVRKSLKTVLGKTAYDNYIRLIQQSGIDPQRFINELLQNADDCRYRPGDVPTFTLTLTPTGIQTEYNELGFTKSNIRAITAIGESTKKRILNKDPISKDEEIGEKGIGFKAVFAVATNVVVHSGNFHFALSAQTPTIPAILSGEKPVVGTRMEFVFNPSFRLNELSEQSVLRLCLCLRRLRRMQIGRYSIRINDSEDMRTATMNHHDFTEGMRIVTINNKDYVFEWFDYVFRIDDVEALEERSGGQREIAPEQRIICYLPRKSTDVAWPVYSGLPTKILANIPMAIDAPYELTTSRDQVLDTRWNELVTEAVGHMLVQLVERKVRDDGIDGLRYLNVDSINQYNMCLSIFNDPDIQWDGLTDALQNALILPTCKKGFITRPKYRNTKRFPAILTKLHKLGAVFDLNSAEIIDDKGLSDYNGTLAFLGCNLLSFDEVCVYLTNSVSSHMGNESFRKALYAYLIDDANAGHYDLKKNMPITPVLKRAGSDCRFITFEQATNQIYVLAGSQESSADYWLLDTNILAARDYLHIFNELVPKMDERMKRELYIESIEKILSLPNPIVIYYPIMLKYLEEKALWDGWKQYLQRLKGDMVFRMQDGSFQRGDVYICSAEDGFLSGDLVKAMSVHSECAELARFFYMKDLATVHYDDISSYEEKLTADDIEDLQSGYFINSIELLKEFVLQEQVPDELISRYSLGSLKTDWENEYDEDDDYDFPSEGLRDPSRMIANIRSRWNQPDSIIKKEVTRMLPFIMFSNGKEVLYTNNEGRDMVIRRYTPQGSKKCFCQMCQKSFIPEIMNALNVVFLPKTYWPELRVALCPTCALRFTKLRRNQSFLKLFYAKLIDMDISCFDNYIKVSIADTELRFTYRHIMEIREILRDHRKELSNTDDYENN